MRFIGRRPVKPLGLVKTPKEEFEMTALVYITPEIIEVIAHITAIK